MAGAVWMGQKSCRHEIEGRHTVLSALWQKTPLPTVLQELVVAYVEGVQTLFVADCENHVVREVSLRDGSARTVPSHTKEQGASLHRPYTLAVDRFTQTLLVGSHSVHSVDANTGFSSLLYEPTPLTDKTTFFGSVVSGSSLFVSHRWDHYIRRIPLNGRPSSVFAGKVRKSGHENGHRSKALFCCPSGLTRDTEGNLYVADTANHVIRKISLAGVVSTVAGRVRVHGFEDGPANTALFHDPSGVAVDEKTHALLVTDCNNHCIRRIDLRTQTVSTLAGCPGPDGRTRMGEVNGTGRNALFLRPHHIVVDSPTGVAFVVSQGSHTIRRVTREGCVSSMWGRRKPGFVDGLRPLFNTPTGLALL